MFEKFTKFKKLFSLGDVNEWFSNHGAPPNKIGFLAISHDHLVGDSLRDLHNRLTRYQPQPFIAHLPGERFDEHWMSSHGLAELAGSPVKQQPT